MSAPVARSANRDLSASFEPGVISESLAVSSSPSSSGIAIASFAATTVCGRGDSGRIPAATQFPAESASSSLAHLISKGCCESNTTGSVVLGIHIPALVRSLSSGQVY